MMQSENEERRRRLRGRIDLHTTTGRCGKFYGCDEKSAPKPASHTFLIPDPSGLQDRNLFSPCSPDMDSCRHKGQLWPVADLCMTIRVVTDDQVINLEQGSSSGWSHNSIEIGIFFFLLSQLNSFLCRFGVDWQVFSKISRCLCFELRNFALQIP